jgi:hypothetical protein
MNKDLDYKHISVVNGEFTRLLLQYWDLLGRPSLSEFVTLLPIETALEHIERVTHQTIEIPQNRH